ncbi:SafA/ExsA family spore coat assembly protein [Lederbergia citrea]|uniref:SafA/ExsA family spore coat assembly protein n=1 Tax=Lederbergia citrea TaxID=2833581 RepID=A0A942UMK9_9BACI|nr:SafA/ExsA family spore coat assembly protein [Lederbergia citrea]MBS4202770.1 SafA/ExsA family spore coat assembly protein [Lederbergia citrea]MBS4222562.1 SafA/ExsA family spore coat assembly protein [Lederbergia citrea]
MKIHIAQKGETLWKIAQKYGVNFEELKQMNAQLSNPDMIMPGMKIKVPSAGGAVKKEAQHHHHHHKPHHVPKEMHHHKPHHVPKEMPKAEHPFIQHKEVPMPVTKEIIKEKPYPVYQPVMPQPLPEIDINNYYMMNQMQTQVQQPMPVKEEVKEVKEEYVEAPVMPPVQPMYNYCYPAQPAMPICDPCYPYPQSYAQPFPHHMMPQVQGAMAYPMPMGHMPMGQPMPAMLPGMPVGEYQTMPQHWEEESSSSSHPHMGMYQQPMHGYPAMPMTMGAQSDCGCSGSNPVGGGYYPPQGMSPYSMQPGQYPAYNPYQYGQMMPSAGTYAMPVRNDVGSDSEEEDE